MKPSTPSPRVFVTQQPKPNKRGWTPNLQPATDFGSLHFIFAGGDRAHCDPAWAVDKAADILRTFDAEQDYLLWPNTGDPAAMMAAMIVLTSVLPDVRQIRLLYWERKIENGIRSTTEGFYTPISFPVPRMNSIKEKRSNGKSKAATV